MAGPCWGASHALGIAKQGCISALSKAGHRGAGVAPSHWLCRYTIKIPPPAPKGAKAAVSAQDHWLMVGGKLPCG